MLHGVAAFREQLAEKLSLARWAYERLRDEPRFEMLDEPQLSVVAFRLRGTAEEADRLGPELLQTGERAPARLPLQHADATAATSCASAS